jgi:outer membrane protein insertion porin family
MAQYYPQQQGYAPQGSAQNLQFFPSSYSSVSGHTTPSQASYGGGFGGAPNPSAQAYPAAAGYGGFGSPAAGVSGRMGEQGGLRTGWLAAFGTEGYDGEPPLLEELGVNFEHIRTKVSCVFGRCLEGVRSGDVGWLVYPGFFGSIGLWLVLG